MKAELKAKWVAALRGGDYKQAKGKLKSNQHIEYHEVPAEALADIGSITPGSIRSFGDVWVLRPLGINDAPVAYKEVDGVGHCCLGVLADIVNPQGWEQETYQDGDDDPVTPDDADWHHAMGDGDDLLFDPASVGLDETLMNDLATLNDNGNPFTVIADLIEKTESL